MKDIPALYEKFYAVGKKMSVKNLSTGVVLNVEILDRQGDLVVVHVQGNPFPSTIPLRLLRTFRLALLADRKLEDVRAHLKDMENMVKCHLDDLCEEDFEISAAALVESAVEINGVMNEDAEERENGKDN